MHSASDILLYYAHKYDNVWDKVYGAVISKENMDDTPLKDIVFSDKHFSPDTITVMDKDYPDDMRTQMLRPPFVIYYKGDLSAINRRDYTFLIGNNKFGLDTKDLVLYDKSAKVLNVGGVLDLYISDIPADILNLGAFISKRMVIDKEINNILAPEFALHYNRDIYVTPTVKPSTNNRLIKDGAFLLDSKEDLLA